MFKKDECTVVSVEVINAAKAREKAEQSRVVQIAQAQKYAMEKIQESADMGEYQVVFAVLDTFYDSVKDWLGQLGYKIKVLDRQASDFPYKVRIVVSW